MRSFSRVFDRTSSSNTFDHSNSKVGIVNRFTIFAHILPAIECKHLTSTVDKHERFNKRFKVHYSLTSLSTRDKISIYSLMQTMQYKLCRCEAGEKINLTNGLLHSTHVEKER